MPHPLRVLVVGAGVGGISVARGLLRDGHDVTVFEQRARMSAGGGAVTIWPNGATVLGQLGVDMAGAGQLLSSVRVLTATGRPIANLDLTTITDRLGAPVRMVPRRVLLERLLDDFPVDRVRCGVRATAVADTRDGVRVDFDDAPRPRVTWSSVRTDCTRRSDASSARHTPSPPAGAVGRAWSAFPRTAARASR